MKNYQTDLPCLVCKYKYPQRTFHHVKHRGSGGSNKPHNLMPLCFYCHEKIHRSLVSMAIKHPSIRYWLEENGWQYCEIRGKWCHPEES
jgi:hypothetical protein